MKNHRILFALLFDFLFVSVFAGAEVNSTPPVAAPSVSAILFGHILDSPDLDIFPFLSPITLPLGMTVHQLMLTLAAALIFTVFAVVFWKPKIKPGPVAVALESVVLFVKDDIVYPIMGEERGAKWLPFFVTLFLFLLVVNLLGLIPAFKTATGNINVTSALAVMITVLIFAVGFYKIGVVQFFKNFYPEDTNPAIGLFVAFLEFFGLFIKSVVLSLRIFANMFAGHLAILSFIMLIFVLSPLFSVISLPFALFTYTLEVLVALIQALVFTLLSCIFISQASSAHGE